jgi:hypothetical protein
MAARRFSGVGGLRNVVRGIELLPRRHKLPHSRRGLHITQAARSYLSSFRFVVAVRDPTYKKAPGAACRGSSKRPDTGRPSRRASILLRFSQLCRCAPRLWNCKKFSLTQIEENGTIESLRVVADRSPPGAAHRYCGQNNSAPGRSAPPFGTH